MSIKLYYIKSIPKVIRGYNDDLTKYAENKDILSLTYVPVTQYNNPSSISDLLTIQPCNSFYPLICSVVTLQRPSNPFRLKISDTQILLSSSCTLECSTRHLRALILVVLNLIIFSHYPVRHYTLLEKMALLNMPDQIYNWFVDYYNGHSHCIRPSVMRCPTSLI